ncbi:galactonate dehydratase [Phyllobacterium trifolii]|uniref:Galactonate dehydratase n=1 Tax=Phyllobacterium trifolii TaxID=300193 RepID=A0A839UJC6_9HYPH|nr:mandelate racemase/muconate lactonizing enzyme family protein [Phyllobacterium trifolii]MBB3148852.1 galactonate dehydratase [Phyllobacterium trifolii]
MKITSIVPWLVKADGTFWGEFLFVEVRTDGGVNGWGEITSTTRMANRAMALILRQVNELLVGDDPANIDLIWHKIFRSFTYMGSRGATTHLISGIDIALWDIRGKVLNQPVCDLLGGRLRDDLLLYTHPEWRNMVDKETSIEEIRKIVDSGHTALKFDPFPHSEGSHAENVGYLDGQLSRKDERIAAELTALVRETAGPDMEILIDAHGRFNVPTAIRLCRTLEDAGDIGWFEEPVPPESYHALKQVRDKVGAAISVGERLHTRWDFVKVFEQELAEFIMPDVTWTGGITELKKIATMAEAYYVPVTPHDASGPINLVAGGHVMMTVPNFYRLETSRCDLSKYNSFLEEPLDNSGGRLKLPAGSGLGLRLNMDFMRSNIIDGFGG